MLTARRAGARLAGLMLLFMPLGCAGQARPAARSSSVTPSEKVAPRWEEVAVYRGSGHARTPVFRIRQESLQWRVRAVCEGPRLEVRLAGTPDPLATPSCPGAGFGFSIDPGRRSLEVRAEGWWTLTVDQQLDTPVSEGRLNGMTEENLVASGEFYGIDREGSGRAALYELPGGRLALRLDPFRVTSNSDLYLWVSKAADPRTSEDAYLSEHAEVAPLTSTAGPQNYLLPEALRLTELRSVVIWCDPIRVAYAAATLHVR